ncbi:MAG: hypothetical protein ABSF95_06070 [Verrucomicrobiota bacterium]
MMTPHPQNPLRLSNPALRLWLVSDVLFGALLAPGSSAASDSRPAQKLFKHPPRYCRDLASDPTSGPLAKEWRQKMIRHLAIRGEAWVLDDDRVVQPKSVLRPDNIPNVIR